MTTHRLRLRRAVGCSLSGLVVLGAGGTLVSADGPADPPVAADPANADDQAPPVITPADEPQTQPPVPALERVGGDLALTIERHPWGFSFGERMKITTPLPDGYPDPTPPGAIDIKRYPSVRRAQVSGRANPDWGMNGGFWPLFQHIQRREIAMTSPVEMDYPGLGPDEGDQPDAWTMAFLYRTPGLGPLGTDRRVEIVDTPPMTVIAVGFRGNYGTERVRAGLSVLEAWLAAQNEWDAAGPARALYYNGPEVRGMNRWGEVQLPVRAIERDAAQPPPADPAPAQPEPAAGTGTPSP